MVMAYAPREDFYRCSHIHVYTIWLQSSAKALIRPRRREGWSVHFLGANAVITLIHRAAHGLLSYHFYIIIKILVTPRNVSSFTNIFVLWKSWSLVEECFLDVQKVLFYSFLDQIWRENTIISRKRNYAEINSISQWGLILMKRNFYCDETNCFGSSYNIRSKSNSGQGYCPYRTERNI